MGCAAFRRRSKLDIRSAPHCYMACFYRLSAFSCGCFLTCSHDGNTEGFRTITKENQRVGVPC